MARPTLPPPAELTTEAVEIELPSPSLGIHPALLVRLDGEVRVVELGPGAGISIGRGGDNDIVIDEPAISRRHARVENQRGTLILTETGRNGVRVGTRKVIGREALRPGDVLSMGGLELLVAGATPRLVDASSNEPPSSGASAGGIIVAEKAMVELYRTVRRLSSLDTTVLIAGETGAGKEVIAQALHTLGSRAPHPFVSLNSAAVPETLLEAELFGHERGAFTGADKKRMGVFQRAHLGTLLLDEIAEMPMLLQAKLLRVLETKRVQPIGSATEIPVDVRIIAATHRDLRRAVKEGSFRADLFFRISAFVVSIPPLRERPSEIALLASELARQFAERHGMPRPHILPSAFEALRKRRWPGNVRELRNAIEHALVLAEDGVIRPEHLPPDTDAEPVESGAPSSPDTAGVSSPAQDRGPLAKIERVALENALRDNNGNQAATARALGISRRALLYKMERLGIRVRRELG